MNEFFVDRFKDRPTRELEEMLQDPSGFQPAAIESAKYVLEKREKGVEEFQEKKKLFVPKEDSESRGLLSRLNTSLMSIAVYQLLTGLFIFVLLSHFTFRNFFVSTIEIIFFLIYLANLFAAILLFNKKVLGIRISIVLQLIHAIHVSFFGLEIFATSLLYFDVIIEFIGLGVNFGIGNMSYLFTLSATENFISINLVSVFALTILFNSLERVKEEKFDDELLKENQLN